MIFVFLRDLDMCNTQRKNISLYTITIFIFIYLFVFLQGHIWPKKTKFSWNKTIQKKAKVCLPNTLLNQKKP
jgi:hypothetical protein